MPMLFEELATEGTFLLSVSFILMFIYADFTFKQKIITLKHIIVTTLPTVIYSHIIMWWPTFNILRRPIVTFSVEVICNTNLFLLS